MVRALMFVPILAGFLALLCGLIVGPRGGGLRAVQESVGLEPVREIEPRLVSPLS
jgi:hypothetical protein